MTTLTTSTEIANLALGVIGSDIQISDLDDTTDNSKERTVASLFYAPVRDALLEMYPWRIAVAHRPLVLTAGYFEFNEEFGASAKVITNITQANPAVVTCANDYSDGDFVRLSSIVGMTEANRDLPFHISSVSAAGFTLTGINSTNWTAYVSGGQSLLQQVKPLYEDGYTYDLPSDFQQALLIEGETIEGMGDFEIVNQKLLTTVEEAVLIYLTNAATTVANWKNSFIEVFYLLLGYRIVIPIVGFSEAAVELKRTVGADVRRAMAQAKLIAAKSIKKTRETNTPWVGHSGLNPESYLKTREIVRLR